MNFLIIMGGIVLGTIAGFLVPTTWISRARRCFWRIVHFRRCPPPYFMARKELLESYQALCWGMPFEVEHFDIRLKCPRRSRIHRAETKVFTQINPFR